jgi:hypothetical protein
MVKLTDKLQWECLLLSWCSKQYTLELKVHDLSSKEYQGPALLLGKDYNVFILFFLSEGVLNLFSTYLFFNWWEKGFLSLLIN